MNYWIKLLLKAIISLGILWYVNISVDWATLIETFDDITFGWVLVSFGATFVSLWLMTWKADIILRGYINYPVKYLVKVTWASDFINLFSLGPIGGEAYKMFAFGDPKQALFASLLDKVITYCWYLLIALSLAIPYWLTEQDLNLTLLWGAVGYIGISILVFIIFIYQKSFIRLIPSTRLKQRILSHHVSLSDAIRHSLISVASLLNIALKYILLFWALGISISVVEMILFIPILLIGLTLPIAIEGVGVREFLFVEFARTIGVSTESALIVSLMVYAITLGYKLTGIIPFLLKKRQQCGNI